MADIFDTDYETYIGELNISNPENAPLKRSQGLMARSRAMAGPRKDFSLPEIGGKLLEAGKVIPGAAVAGAAEGFVGLPGDIESFSKRFDLNVQQTKRESCYLNCVVIWR
jgi:hypothetical protein